MKGARERTKQGLGVAEAEVERRALRREAAAPLQARLAGGVACKAERLRGHRSRTISAQRHDEHMRKDIFAQVRVSSLA